MMLRFNNFFAGGTKRKTREINKLANMNSKDVHLSCMMHRKGLWKTWKRLNKIIQQDIVVRVQIIRKNSDVNGVKTTKALNNLGIGCREKRFDHIAARKKFGALPSLEITAMVILPNESCPVCKVFFKLGVVGKQAIVWSPELYMEGRRKAE